MKNKLMVVRSGRKFGKLTVLEDGIGYKHKVLCRCKCGNEKPITIHNLIQKGSKTCGCAKGFCRKNKKYTPTPDILFGYKSKWRAYTVNAKRRNKIWELPPEEFISLINGNCHYCGFTGGGVDIIDSAVGYLPTNCVSCCSICNIMKNRISRTDFIRQIVKIHKHLCENKIEDIMT